MNKYQYGLYRVFRWFHMHLFGLKPGCFIQDPTNTHIGDNVQISHGVHIYTRNHSLRNLRYLEVPDPVDIGDGCWLGANSIILPGVVLGSRTVVGAGSVVTKSFSDGCCVIGGNPARFIKALDGGVL